MSLPSKRTLFYFVQLKENIMSNKPKIVGQMQAHLDSHKTGGQRWPDMAEYAIKSCTPGDKTSSMEFFLNRADLDDRLLEIKDTGMAYQCYQWDLGPYAMTDLHQYTDSLPLTAAERSTS